MDDMEEKTPATVLYDELDKTMWITKHSRYNASDRLRRKHSISIYTISILSIYALVLTLLEKYGFQVSNCNIYEFSSVLLALFILVLSLTEASKNYMVSSERLFVCGNNIRDLLDELKKFNNGSETDVAGIEALSSRYSHVLKACGENHETIDYDLLRAQRPKDFNDLNWFAGLYFKMKYMFNIYGLYFVLIVIPPVLFWKFK
ncbi:SLATT domain-containing protein [uncultured Desulfuromonas sp.]|uniref:SLATT domain-containing protein n=1 Tax=uncultured Desulfuromonas sp. TaxID=181013 RepID=UPI002AAAFA93|nr:SLATT domain-containing protein [uncultured Desulfuromonas sp.]